MSKKMMLLALSAISAALLVVPAAASANLPVHLKGVTPPLNFTGHGGASVLERSDGLKTEGTTTTVTGTFDTTTTGRLKILFHGVKNAFGNCNSSGYASGSGTVETTELPFHLVTLDGGVPGILITPATGPHFASYTCPLSSVVVRGNGILGTITAPKCNEASNTATIAFAQGGVTGNQNHQNQTGTTYNLTASVNGGAALNSSMTASATITFAGGAKPELECT